MPTQPNNSSSEASYHWFNNVWTRLRGSAKQPAPSVAGQPLQSPGKMPPPATDHPENWLQKGWNRVRKFFDFSKPGNAPLNTELPKTAKNEEMDAQFEALSKHFEFESNVFSGMSEDLRNQVKGVMVTSWNLGFHDGVIGQKQMPLNYFSVHAEQLRDQLLFFLKSKKMPAQMEFEERETLFEKSKEILQQAQNYRNDAATRQQIYPRNYSIPLATIYIIVAGLLLLADVPLALMITRVIFRINPPDEFHGIEYLFFRPAEDYCAGFLAHFWRVATGNWQIVLMTIGVALSAIYFKIFYDDFMGFAPDKAATKFRHVFQHNQADDEETQRFEKRRAVLYNWIQVGVKFIILIFVVWTIIYLGFVRAAAERVQSVAGRKAPVDTVKPVYNNPTDSMAIVQTPPISDDLKAAQDDLEHKKKWLFILLTILLPTMAGICFSLGMSNLHNHKEAKYAEKLFKAKLEEYNQALLDRSKAEKENEIFQEFINKCQKDEFVKNYETSFYNCYLHGYQRGVVSPDKDLDIYERAKKLRDRMLATKSIEAIQRANEMVKYVDPIVVAPDNNQ